jgi:hypothetical protein
VSRVFKSYEPSGEWRVASDELRAVRRVLASVGHSSTSKYLCLISPARLGLAYR